MKKKSYSYKKKYLSKFKGHYIYRIYPLVNSARTIYIGETANISKRMESHLHNHSGGRTDSAYHNWCKANGIDKALHGVEVMDLSFLSDSIDKSDRVLIQDAHVHYYQPLLNKKFRKKFEPYEIERLEQLNYLIADTKYVDRRELNQAILDRYNTQQSA